MDADSLRALETSGVLLLELEEMEKAKAVSCRETYFFKFVALSCLQEIDCIKLRNAKIMFKPTTTLAKYSVLGER